MEANLKHVVTLRSSGGIRRASVYRDVSLHRWVLIKHENENIPIRSTPETIFEAEQEASRYVHEVDL